MKKNEADKHSRELRNEFLKYGVLLFIWVCFLIYQIIWIANNPSLNSSAVWLAVFSSAVLVALLSIAGVGLYRQSISYMRWYNGILDSIPVSLIATDKDAVWLQANKIARETVNIKQGHSIEKLNSRQLIGADGNVTKKVWMQGATEYKIMGNHLYVGGEDVGHIILFYNMSELRDSGDTRTELIDEINRLLDKLSIATVHFSGYAKTLAGSTIQQAGIIHELSDVIAGIADGTLNEPDELNEKMGIVQAHMQCQAESSQQQIDKMCKTVGDLADTHDLINGVLRNIDNVP